MLKGGLTVLFFHLFLFSFGQGIQKEIPLGTNAAKFGYLEYLPASYLTDSSFPLIVFLHGIGERGNGTTDLYKVAKNGPPKLIKAGAWPVKNPAGKYPSSEFIVISPQSSSGFPSPTSVHEFIDFLKSYYKVDEKRVYLVGLSAGGISTWRYLGSYNDQIAASIPICGHANGYLDKLCISKEIPIWAFHGDVDPTVNVSGSKNAINALNSCVPIGKGPHLLTIYNGTGHDSWTYTFNLSWINKSWIDPTYDPFNISIYDWLLQFSKGTTLEVNLDQDKTTTLPTNSITLNSTVNSTNPIQSYAWTKQSGSAASLVNAATSTLTVDNMLTGTYIFRLTVTDNQGNQAFDEVTVTVLPEVINQSPVANAGPDRIMALPTNIATFSGSGSDGDGSIVSYAWTKVSGPTVTLQNLSTTTLTVLSLLEGNYVFGLTVTDDDGAKGYDEVKLTVEKANAPPSVNTGPDKVIQLPTNTLVINGTASDSDGSIASYQWTKRSGPTASLQNYTTANLTASNLLEGTYIFRLSVADDKGATAYDEVSVIVQSVNQAPIAYAGADKILKLPVNNTTLNGSGTDNDGSVVSYNWIKVSGPVASLTNTSSATLSISNLAAGIYLFGLTVSDDDGATGYDEVSVTVNAANQAPTAKAGEDIILYLPTNSTSIDGVGSDVDGSITAYQWLKKSGPAVTISNANQPTVSFGGMVEGTYTFILTVTDNEGATATDEVLVYVLVSNNPPTAKAGPDKNITLPTNQINLTGSGTDNDGSIVSYEWIKVSGPAVTLNDAGTAVLRLTNLVDGIYVFGLTVKDDDGDTSYDEVKLTVSPEPMNILPVVNAGVDIAITLPVNSAALSATASDADGTIASYLWEKISGPAATISSDNTANTNVSNMAAGSYVFRVTVIDNKGATALDEVKVTVYEAYVNKSPVVNTGPDITIRLPLNIVTFSPTVTDSDGTIASVQWTQVSGPASATFNNNTIQNVQISNLVTGIYTFRLAATDNQGASSSDEIKVLVADANQAPIVNAGKDLLLQLPINSVSLTANASDSDGSITSYLWSRFSGPNGETMNNISGQTVNIINLSQGVYVFQVKVTDNEGATASEQVKVTVQAENIIPVANAGNDIEIRLPENSTNLNGAGSDADGTIVSYQWSKESGPMASMINQNTATLTLNNLVAGTYIFRLTVTDNNGTSNFDDAKVTVLPELVNNPPVANAGADKQITLPTNTATFNGSGSDADGSIATYQWVKLSGPSVTMTNAGTATLSLSNLVQGSYVFRLTVTDNGGASATDDVQLIVNAELVNQNPVANAGSDHIITLPTNSLNINGLGSDPDGSIVSYLWHKVSGPSVTMTNANNSVLTLNDLVAGTYTFRLTVQDNNGASASDLVTVVVNAEDVNQIPIAYAGPNISLSLPTNTAVLSGTGSDADGNIVSYSWQKVSGPGVTLANANTATLTATSLVEGTYVFRLTVVDNDGARSSDEVRVIVVRAEVNSNPVVNAGNDVIIQLPTKIAVLKAEAFDKDGSIVSYEWLQIGGTTTTISNPTLATMSVSNLNIGVYTFRVTVTDNEGATDFDEIKVIVEPENVNLAPVASAGENIQIFLPTNSVNVTGTGSDADGSIVSYNWIKISGPDLTMTNTSKATVTFSELTEGEYTFRFTVMDSDGGTSQDELNIHVTPLKVNQAPIANAGDDINLYLPVNSIKILGGGNDVDGEIVSYMWEQVSGLAVIISEAEKPELDLTDLVEGVYEFKLTITDNEGATGTDYVIVNLQQEETNLPPFVELGDNFIVNLPLDSLVLSGKVKDTDGLIVKYTWLKISGANITMLPDDASLVLKDLKEGTYIFRLTVQDNDGAKTMDNILITIYPVGANRNPVSNAGIDVQVTMPQDFLTIFGQGSDPDGDDITFNWEQLSGPTIVALEGIDNAELHLSNLVEGAFVFELVVTDEKGATASDRVNLVVNPVPPDNIPPVADAGEDISITFPVDNYVLIGNGSDADGLILSHQWRMVNGPMIDNQITYSDTLVLYELASGTYLYEFLVMDNDSAYATDEISIRVETGDISGIGAHKIFSPDGNGIDDYWEIDNLEKISGCHLTIFNRFGLQVFESNNYYNEWDGTYKGKTLPEGDYYFVIRCGDGTNTASGGIRIIREY